LLENGFDCFRGPQPSWGHRARQQTGYSPLDRFARLADAYLGLAPPPTTAWSDVRQDDGLCDVPASTFFRPFDPKRKALEPLRLARIKAGLRSAARHGRIFHLWWHPHNFSRYPRQSFEILGKVLDEYERLAVNEGLRSFTMRDVARVCGIRPTTQDSLSERIASQGSE